ncbi:MAG: thiosulfate/3-mercaptopyruvate sulfurtransferase [Halieaceae bacterium]|jgi:thiosulfate/3-mercaptopyruvate sulfurtransferase
MSPGLFLSATSAGSFSGAIIDCRFALGDPQAGANDYVRGHIPGAVYLDLNRDMSGPVGPHGGRHPLPSPGQFAAGLAERGIGLSTPVLLYDDSRYAFAARCWWMMRALGYQSVQLLAGGFSAWLGQGGVPETTPQARQSCAVPVVADDWPRCCTREELADLQGAGAVLVDAREEKRYRGEEESIDPLAGHIPGAHNLPWQGFSDSDGLLLGDTALRERWGELGDASPLVVYCGSGVSACVNILSLAAIGRDDVWLYGGSWSDWCSYL